MTAQLTFELPHRPALGQADFLVAEPNRAAVAQIDAWPQWPLHALALAGPPGCGKSHLASVWARRADARTVDANDIQWRPEAVDTAPHLVVEDGDRGLDERGLLHLFNLTRELGGTLLLTGRSAPARWPVGLPDLASRLATVPVAAIDDPDDALLSAVLDKLFRDRQLKVPPAVIGYLLLRMERSFDGARALVEALDATALRQQRTITTRLAADVLKAQQSPA